MISKQEVQHIAKLARLELTDEEINKMQKDLSAILDYFELLKHAPQNASEAGIAGQAPDIGNKNLRKDEAISQNREAAEKIIAASPDKKDDYIKVKAIL